MEQSIDLPLKVGAKVEVFEECDIDADDGMMASVVYEGIVRQYVPETGKLVMSDGTGLAEFKRIVREADGYQVVNQYNQ